MALKPGIGFSSLAVLLAGAGMLVLNHLIPADDPAFAEAHWRAAVTPVFGGSLVVGRDGLVISL